MSKTDKDLVSIEGKIIIGFYRYDLAVMKALGKDLPPGKFKVACYVVEGGEPVRLGCAFGASKRDALRGLESILQKVWCEEVKT